MFPDTGLVKTLAASDVHEAERAAGSQCLAYNVGQIEGILQKMDGEII